MPNRKNNRTSLEFLEYLTDNNITISKATRKAILSSIHLKDDLTKDSGILLSSELRGEILFLFNKFILSKQNAKLRSIDDKIVTYDQVGAKLKDTSEISFDIKEQILYAKSIDEIYSLDIDESTRDKLIEGFNLYKKALQEKAQNTTQWKKDNPELFQDISNNIISEKDLFKYLFQNYLGLSELLNKHSGNSEFERFKSSAMKIFKEMSNDVYLSEENVLELLSKCLFYKLNKYNKDKIQEEINKQLSTWLISNIASYEVKSIEIAILTEVMNYLLNFRHNFQFSDNTINAVEHMKLPHDLKSQDIKTPYPISHLQFTKKQSKRLNIPRNIIVRVDNQPIYKQDKDNNDIDDFTLISGQNERIDNMIQHYKELNEKLKNATDIRTVTLTTFEPHLKNTVNITKITRLMINGEFHKISKKLEKSIHIGFSPLRFNFTLADTMTIQDTLDYAYLSNYLYIYTNKIKGKKYSLSNFPNEWINDSIRIINEYAINSNNIFYQVITLFALLNDSKRREGKNTKHSIFYEDNIKKSKNYEDIIIKLRNKNIVQHDSKSQIKINSNSGNIESNQNSRYPQGTHKRPHFRRSHYRFIRTKEDGLVPVFIHATFVNEDMLLEGEEFLSPTYKI